MNEFDYKAPTTIEEVTAFLARGNGNASVLSGGTDLLVQLREGQKSAELLVDVKKIPELMRIKIDPEQGLVLGASVSCHNINQHKQISKIYPGLTDATRIIGAWQIQSRASVGGNLCNASPAADSIPPLICYGATCHIAGPANTRKVPASEFCTAPGKSVLQRGEILVAIELPPQPEMSSAYYQRFIPRNEMDIAVVGVCSWVKLDAQGQTIESARIGLAAVAPTPLFAREASEWLTGKPATSKTFAKVGELAKKAASPISDLRAPAEYRVHLVGVLTKRTLSRAVNRARGIETGIGTIEETNP